MTHKIRTTFLLFGVSIAMIVLLVSSVIADELQPSVFDQELQKVRYEMAYQPIGGSAILASASDSDVDEELSLADLARVEAEIPEYKSPGRAFLYSLAVPGLGQYYYGSKIKPFIFLAAEITGIVFANKWHGEGNDLTVDYERFNDLHWNVADSIYIVGEDTLLAYDSYLQLAYGSTVWDSIQDSTGITHRLPNTRTQQYYEMTGKYDQFAWGWDDATLDDLSLRHWTGTSNIQPATEDNVPVSDNRMTYEVMRDNANSRYSKSMRMVFGVMANHLISAFEAYFTTKRHNNNLRYDQEFARWDVDAKLRSYNSWQDTPYVTVTYKF